MIRVSTSRRGASRRARETESRDHWLNLAFVVIALFGALMTVTYLTWLDTQGRIGIDFRGTTWEPGAAILDGRSPYPSAAIGLETWPTLYPPPYLLVFSPLSLLPFEIATGIWIAALAVSITGALLLVGLRDRRCLVVALLSRPVAAAIGAGNATVLLMLTTSLLWRWRDRPHLGAVAFAGGLLIKPILWPLLVWLLVTRRFKLALEAATLSAIVALIGWALLGFDELAEYPGLLSAAADVMASNGLLITNLLFDAGLPLRGAGFASLLLGAALLVGSARSRSDLERFALGIAAALIMTPVMWVHYFLLLYVPLTVRYPRLSLAWLAPPLLWVIAFAYDEGTRPWWTSVVGLFVVVALLAAFLRRGTLRERSPLTAGV
jgi:alpha-1,2-mannosyltransferase